MRGRARKVAVSTAGLLALLLAGCGLPDGIDGDLTAGWAAMPAPASFVPAVGVCHVDDYQQSRTVADYRPVDCAEPHLTETVHVGEFTGNAGDRARPPRPGSGTWRSAFRECDDRAEQYLGRDFRYARLWLGVTVPSRQAWEGGARWFRCEVLGFDDARLLERAQSSSLADALAGDSALLLTCFEVSSDGDSIQGMDPVDCDEPHQAEFVGLWQAPNGPYPDGADQNSANQVHQGCRERVADYVGVPIDSDLAFRTGTIADWMEADDWDNGDRKFRCYLWLSGEDLTGSLAGAGPDGLPAR